MHVAVDRVIGVMDNAGFVIACSELTKIGEARVQAKEEMSFTTDIAVIDGFTYQHIGNSANSEFVVFVEGEDKLAERYVSILAISLANIKSAGKEGVGEKRYMICTSSSNSTSVELTK